MANYISLLQFTDQGIRNVKDTVNRGTLPPALRRRRWVQNSSTRSGPWARTISFSYSTRLTTKQ
jgi:hypothetical protein